MAHPIVFISHHRIKPGKAEPMKALLAEIWSAMETDKPQTLMNSGRSRSRHRVSTVGRSTWRRPPLS